MHREAFGTWESLVAALTVVGMVALLVWFLVLYVLVLTVGSRGSSLSLSWLERRFASGCEVAQSTSHRQWQHFRARHFGTARAVDRAHRTRFRPLMWLASGILVIALVIVVIVGVASMLSGSSMASQGVVFAVAFLAPVPWLISMSLSRAFWQRRARAEWQVVLLGDRFVGDADQEIDQDLVALRAGQILSVLGRRFPRDTAWRRTATEQGLWMPKLGSAITMRAMLIVTDHTERREWSGWVATWLDRVSDSFNNRAAPTVPTESDALTIDTRDRDGLMLGWLIVICFFFAAASSLIAGAAEGFDWSVIQSVWDSAVTQVTAVVALIGGILGVIKYLRGGER